MIKKLLLFVLLFGVSAFLFAQDVIVKTDGSEIKTKVIEITDLTLKFRLFDKADAPIISINKSDVFMVIYENGTREAFTKQLAESIYISEYKGRYFMLGAGFGTSYGGAGIKAQFRTGNKIGIGFHVGLGFIPFTDNGIEDEGIVGFSTGVKFFIYKGFYFNTQVGVTNIEQKYSYMWNNNYYGGYGYNYSREYNAIWGVSTLVGGDWVWGKKVGFGFNAAIGPSFNFNCDNNPITIALDLGFIVRF